MLTKIKDKAIKTALNMLVSDLGEINELSIDKATKSAHVKLDLKGEQTLVVVDLGYDIVERFSKKYLHVQRIEVANKEWLHQLAQKQVCDREFRVPDKLSGVIEMII